MAKFLNLTALCILVFFAHAANAEKYLVCEYKKVIPGTFNDIRFSITQKNDPKAHNEDFMSYLELGNIYGGQGHCKPTEDKNIFNCGVICDSGSFKLTFEKEGAVSLELGNTEVTNRFTLSCGGIIATELIGNTKKITLKKPKCRYWDGE